MTALVTTRDFPCTTVPQRPVVATRETDERFDGLTRLARRHFNIDIALIVLTDGERHRLKACEAAPDASIVGLAELAAGLALHPAPAGAQDGSPAPAFERRFQELALPPGLLPDTLPLPVAFHASYPLLAADGARLGMLCLLDRHPRQLGEAQCALLRDLAGLATALAESDVAERAAKADIDALREREKRMAMAIEGSGTGIWDRNVATGEIQYSTGWKAMLGYADHEIGTAIDESYTRVHPEDLAYVQATMQAHFACCTESYEVEHRLRCKDGAYKWVQSRGRVVSRDDDGNALRMVGTTTDITATRMIAEQLKQSVRLITSLTDEVPGLVFQYRRFTDGASHFTYASAGIKDIYELTPRCMIASDEALDSLIHRDDLAAYRSSLAASAAALTPWHLEYRVILPRQGLRWRQGDARPARLADGSIQWHGFITDITERKTIEAELREFATIDFVTRLANRRHFMALAEAELLHIQRHHGTTAAILMCDLDHFKSINDRWGHAVGDLALRHFAAIVSNELHHCGFAGRVGGEEFAIVLRDADIVAAALLAERIQHQLANTPLWQENQQVPLTVSIGVSAMTAADVSTDAPISRSDMALYRAKTGGRNRVVCN